MHLGRPRPSARRKESLIFVVDKLSLHPRGEGWGEGRAPCQ